MSDDATALREKQLLQRVRDGDNDAYQELYSDHIEGARQLGRILVGADQGDELVSESFARVLASLRSGGGPTENFRAYLHVTIRNGYRDSLRATREAPVSDQPWLLDETGPAVEEMVDGLDESVATDALATLPERWQQVLWHVEVEGRKPAEVADLMDLEPRTVSSLAHRAREGLKRAYLDLHAGPEPDSEQCRWVHARMSQSARGDLSARAQRKLDDHLAECDDCAAAFLVVDRVNQRLAAYVLPLVLLGVLPASGKAVAWLTGIAGAAGGTAAGGAAAAGGSGGAGASGGSSFGGPVAAGAAATVVVAAVAAGAWAVAAHHKHPAPQTPAAAHAAPHRVIASQQQASAPPAAHGKVAPQGTSPALPAVVPPASPGTGGGAPAPTPKTTPSARASTTPTATPSSPSSPSSPSTPTSVPTSPSTSPTTAACGSASTPCTVLVSVTRARQPGNTWQVTTDVEADGGPDRAITVVLTFGRPVVIPAGGLSGAGWSCTSRAGSVGGSRPVQVTGQLTPVTCTFSYAGTTPPSLGLTAVESSPFKASLKGTASMRSGSDRATRPFSG